MTGEACWAVSTGSVPGMEQGEEEGRIVYLLPTIGLGGSLSPVDCGVASGSGDSGIASLSVSCRPPST